MKEFKIMIIFIKLKTSVTISTHFILIYCHFVLFSNIKNNHYTFVVASAMIHMSLHLFL